MVMTAEDATGLARELRGQLNAERMDLDEIRRYWTGRQALPAVIPNDAPREVRVMAKVSRVNVIRIVIESITQSKIVTGIRTSDQRDDEVARRAWAIWQANAMDRRQARLYRATAAYGYGFMPVLPGRPAPVMRPYGPRQVTTRYAPDDDMWPVHALIRESPTRFRLLDHEAVYDFGIGDNQQLVLRQLSDGSPAIREHGARDGGQPVCPVVRYVDAEDADLEDEAPSEVTGIGVTENECGVVAGQVAPLMPLQDQINMTSFALKSAEWYAAFRQRWIIGTKLDPTKKVQASASQLWSFDEEPDRMKVGEFGQTELRGYLDSRADAAKFAATLSQTPVHELIGELVNLSAEALAAAEVGRDRMVDERRLNDGESHEQALRLACSYEGRKLPVDVEMTWKDTSARAFGAVVDGLGKIAQMLQVPPQELWSRIPGVTKQDVERWKKTYEAGDSIAQMNDLLDRQAGGAGGGERRTDSGIILPPGTRI